MNRVLAVRSLVPQVNRTLTTSTKMQVQNTVKESQTKFQSPDGVPIHLKKGFVDYALYSFAMGLTFVGTVWSCASLFKLSFKK